MTDNITDLLKGVGHSSEPEKVPFSLDKPDPFKRAAALRAEKSETEIMQDMKDVGFVSRVTFGGDTQSINRRVELPVLKTHDNQMHSDYTYCPRLYAVRHVRGFTRRRIGTIGGGSNATSYGALLHEGLDEYYKTLQANREDPRALAMALYTATEKIKQLEKDGLWTDPVDDFRTSGRCIHDLMEYAKEYGTDKELKILGTETSFDLMDDEGFRYGGRIDLPVEYHSAIWNMDHKTTTRFGGYYFDNYKLSPQMLGYTWATGKLHGKPARGVIINCIVLHKGKTEFHRRPMLYSEGHLNQWKQRTIARLWEIAARLEKDPQGLKAFDVSVWTPNFENCIGKYGPCSMFNVCSMNPQNYETKLNMDYEYKPWDFTKKQIEIAAEEAE